MLVLTIDLKLIFVTHINRLSKKSQKLNKVAAISNYITFDKRKIIMKAFIRSQFRHCFAMWMFHSKRLVRKINALHERSLRITYGDYGDKTSSFNELL